MAGRVRVGIDVGGTKIEAVAIGATGGEVFRARVATPKGDYDATVRAIVGLASAAMGGASATVGVAIPGAISPASGLVKNANATWLIGRSLDRDLAQALGLPVRLANDANCFAVSEAIDGAGAGAAVVFGVILGTGVGGGVAVQCKPWIGRNAIAGEWGHNPLPWADRGDAPPPQCYCGRRGCIETYLSGPGMSADFARATGRRLAAEQIAELAAAGEAAACACLDSYVDRLARALAHVVNILDPDVIVLGGGVSKITRLYDDVPRRWRAHVFSDDVTTPLQPARHGDSSGVRGAAWLWGPGDDPID